MGKRFVINQKDKHRDSVRIRAENIVKNLKPIRTEGNEDEFHKLRIELGKHNLDDIIDIIGIEKIEAHIRLKKIERLKKQ